MIPPLYNVHTESLQHQHKKCSIKFWGVSCAFSTARALQEALRASEVAADKSYLRCVVKPGVNPRVTLNLNFLIANNGTLLTHFFDLFNLLNHSCNLSFVVFDFFNILGLDFKSPPVDCLCTICHVHDFLFCNRFRFGVHDVLFLDRFRFGGYQIQRYENLIPRVLTEIAGITSSNVAKRCQEEKLGVMNVQCVVNPKFQEVAEAVYIEAIRLWVC